VPVTPVISGGPHFLAAAGRARAAEAIAHLHEVAGKLAELSALLGDAAGEGKS